MYRVLIRFMSRNFAMYGYTKPLDKLRFICLMLFIWFYWISQQYILSCKKEESGRRQLDPLFGFLTLHNSCHATSNHFSSLGYFEGRQQIINNFASNMLKDYNISDLRVWDDINPIVPFSNDTIKIPPTLANIFHRAIWLKTYIINGRLNQ